VVDPQSSNCGLDSFRQASLIEHLDICTTWKGLTYQKATELLFWEKTFVSILESLIQNQVSWLKDENEIPTSPTSANTPSDNGKAVSRSVRVDFSDVVVNMVCHHNKYGRHHTWFASTSNVYSTVARFVRTRECFFGTGSPMTEKTTGDAWLDVQLGPEKIYFDSEKSDPYFENTLEIQWHPNIITFHEFDVITQEGHDFVLMPRVCGLTSTDFGPYSTISYDTSASWLKWDPDVNGFRGRVPLCSELPHSSSERVPASQPDRPTYSDMETMRIIVTAVVTEFFGTAVRWVRKLRSRVSVKVLPYQEEDSTIFSQDGQSDVSSIDLVLPKEFVPPLRQDSVELSEAMSDVNSDNTAPSNVDETWVTQKLFLASLQNPSNRRTFSMLPNGNRNSREGNKYAALAGMESMDLGDGCSSENPPSGPEPGAPRWTVQQDHGKMKDRKQEQLQTSVDIFTKPRTGAASSRMFYSIDQDSKPPSLIEDQPARRGEDIRISALDLNYSKPEPTHSFPRFIRFRYSGNTTNALASQPVPTNLFTDVRPTTRSYITPEISASTDGPTCPFPMPDTPPGATAALCPTPPTTPLQQPSRPAGICNLHTRRLTSIDGVSTDPIAETLRELPYEVDKDPSFLIEERKLLLQIKRRGMVSSSLEDSIDYGASSGVGSSVFGEREGSEMDCDDVNDKMEDEVEEVKNRDGWSEIFDYSADDSGLWSADASLSWKHIERAARAAGTDEVAGSECGSYRHYSHSDGEFSREFFEKRKEEIRRQREVLENLLSRSESIEVPEDWVW
jgi:hypothetical protein